MPQATGRNKAKHRMKLRPINDRVVIKPDAPEEKTQGGIILPETAQEKPRRGTVVAVGSGKPGQTMTLKAGDVVMFGKYAGNEIEEGGEEFLVMREDDILVIIE